MRVRPSLMDVNVRADSSTSAPERRTAPLVGYGRADVTGAWQSRSRLTRMGHQRSKPFSVAPITSTGEISAGSYSPNAQHLIDALAIGHDDTSVQSDAGGVAPGAHAQRGRNHQGLARAGPWPGCRGRRSGGRSRGNKAMHV